MRELRKHSPLKTGLFGKGTGTVHAVDDISFSVMAGETLGIVGESGCSKSTTARILMRLIDPDTGRVLLDGKGIAELPPNGLPVRDARRQMQMVFQDSIAFGLIVHGLPQRQAKARARELLDKVGLAPERFAARYPHELSGGQRQRINIARALALEPRIVILDEAVSGLDKSVEAQVLNLLLDLKKEFGLTYLFISHDLNVVRYMSDRVMVMYLGKVAEIGPVELIYAKTAHPYTSALLSAMPSMDPGRRTEAPPLVGDPPTPIDPPPGCRFRTRCPYAEPICAAGDPVLALAGEAHHVACLMIKPGSGRSQAQAAAQAA